MKENNKTCITCSKVYSYCNKCSQYSSWPQWHNIFCSENCRQIFHIASDYNAKIIDEKEAKKRFASCDLSNRKCFKESILKLIASLMTIKPIRSRKTKNDIVPDEVEIEAIIDETPSVDGEI